ncbi:hypothetical protein N4T77_12590 [Clostridium sp. CX1]|uniref:hypothetical protein n=1 Tax=Clostridium sp. CX1 TaxID=2978346 RepID=UPI0021BE9A16|nr:hypothetical protein [Clostridium sp. CX1]MCT8977441.1 hypothetical protein [Clostridium sp. CX1]
MNLKDIDKDLYDIMDMNEDEFTDYMIEEYNKKPSDSEIIVKSGKTIENLINEINAYHDKLVFLAYKYELSLKNKAAFILKLCQHKENIYELMPLLSCFICRTDYLFELKSKKTSIRNEGGLAEYLLLKEDIDAFEKNVKQVYLNIEKYRQLSKKIKVGSSNINQDISSKNKKLLVKLYKQYVQRKGKNKDKKQIDSENKFIEENIEQIHNFAMETAERQRLYPLIVFQLFIHYKTKITKEMELLNRSNLLKYKKYDAVEKDNGKNFNTYSNYIALFLELVDNFSDVCDISLCMHGFEKTSNLVEWLVNNSLYKNIFHYTIYSLVGSTYSSIFYEESIFWTDSNLSIDDYNDFEVRDEDNQSNKGQYLSTLIESKLEEKDVLEYLNEYAKGRRQAAKFIKNFAYNFLKSNNCKLANREEEGYIFLIFEGEFQAKADDVIKQRVVELLE